MIISKKLLFVRALWIIIMLPSCAEKREIKKQDDTRERDYKKDVVSINRQDDRASLTETK